METLEYINKRVEEFKNEDGHLYAIYGTPAENLCGVQVQQFRKSMESLKMYRTENMSATVFTVM